MARPDGGTLVLVVGPSGVGKDSLIAYARSRLADDDRVVFPRRLITRPPDDGVERHLPISDADFRRDVAAGAFALHWHAHGFGYGIPATIATDLEEGRLVVVNVSRAVIGEARRRFRPLAVVSVTAPPDVLAARLRHRGRENAEAIDGRLAHKAAFTVAGEDVVRLENAGPLAAVGDRFLKLLASFGAGQGRPATAFSRPPRRRG